MSTFSMPSRRYVEGDDMFYLIGGGEMLVRSAYDFEVFNIPRVVPPPNAKADLERVVRLT